jgi:hypothetical protein
MQRMQNAAEVSVSPAESHAQAAQTRIEEVRAMRSLIPELDVPLPPTANGLKVLSTAASVSPELVAATATARANHPELVHGSAVAPEKMRDLIAFAAAYEPFANELESFARFVRARVAQAKNVAGSEALQTYNLASRLVKRPGYDHLGTELTAIRQLLGRRFTRKSKQTPAPAPQPATDTTETME